MQAAFLRLVGRACLQPAALRLRLPDRLDPVALLARSANRCRAAGFVERGAFRWLRHPVYLSFLGLIWFTPRMTLDHALLTGDLDAVRLCWQRVEGPAAGVLFAGRVSRIRGPRARLSGDVLRTAGALAAVRQPLFRLAIDRRLVSRLGRPPEPAATIARELLSRIVPPSIVSPGPERQHHAGQLRTTCRIRSRMNSTVGDDMLPYSASTSYDAAEASGGSSRASLHGGQDVRAARMHDPAANVVDRPDRVRRASPRAIRRSVSRIDGRHLGRERHLEAVVADSPGHHVGRSRARRAIADRASCQSPSLRA